VQHNYIWQHFMTSSFHIFTKVTYLMIIAYFILWNTKMWNENKNNINFNENRFNIFLYHQYHQYHFSYHQIWRFSSLKDIIIHVGDISYINVFDRRISLVLNLLCQHLLLVGLLRTIRHSGMDYTFICFTYFEKSLFARFQHYRVYIQL